jgi:DHA2 family multidrug resistance protein
MSSNVEALSAPRVSGKERAGINPILIIVILTIATFMEVLDTSIANVSLPHIAGSLSAGQDESTWVLTSYLVANAIILPISGWLATVFGRKRFYMTCVALFTASSFFCGVSMSLAMLIFFRVLQGLGGGGLAPSEQSIIADTVPPQKRGLAFAIYGLGVVFAPAIGPTVGGWITDNYSWHWIFFINVPVGILSLFLTWHFVHEPKSTEQARAQMFRGGFQIDYLGILLFALGLGCLQVVLDKGDREDWFQSSFIITFSIIAAVSLIIGTVWEIYQKNPAVEVQMLWNRNFASAFVLLFAIGFILFGSTLLLPLFAQTLLGYSATQAGKIISPGGFLVMLLMPMVGFLLQRVEARRLILVGLVISALALLNMTNFSLQIDFSTLAWARVYQAAGLAFLFVPVNTAAYTGIPPGKSNNVSALMNLSRNIGGSFGIALVTTLLSRRAQFHQNRLSDHLTPYDSNYQSAMRQMTQTMQSKGFGAMQAMQQAQGRFYGAVVRQATMLAFVDIFKLLMIIVLLMIPLVFLLKPNKPGRGIGGH